MAELQGFFMFFKNQPEKAAAQVGPYLESRRGAIQEAGGIPPSTPSKTDKTMLDAVREGQTASTADAAEEAKSKEEKVE